MDLMSDLLAMALMLPMMDSWVTTIPATRMRETVAMMTMKLRTMVLPKGLLQREPAVASFRSVARYTC